MNEGRKGKIDSATQQAESTGTAKKAFIRMRQWDTQQLLNTLDILLCDSWGDGINRIAVTAIEALIEDREIGCEAFQHGQAFR